MINANYLNKELVNSEIELNKLNSKLNELSKSFNSFNLIEGSLKLRNYKTGRKTVCYQYYDENHIYRRVVLDLKNPEDMAIYDNYKNTYFTKMKISNLEHYIKGLKSLIKQTSIICSNNELPEVYMLDIESIIGTANNLTTSSTDFLSNTNSNILSNPTFNTSEINQESQVNQITQTIQANSADSTNLFWDSLSDRSNSYFPENLICKGYNGFYRSKSEAAISVALHKNNIEFKYEPCLTIEKRTYYPDFILLSPLTNEPIIWEHFGYKDDKEYNMHAKNKINAYESIGFYINRNFIITCETKKNPFTEIDVQNALNFINNLLAC